MIQPLTLGEYVRLTGIDHGTAFNRVRAAIEHDELLITADNTRGLSELVLTSEEWAFWCQPRKRGRKPRGKR